MVPVVEYSKALVVAEVAEVAVATMTLHHHTLPEHHLHDLRKEDHLIALRLVTLIRDPVSGAELAWVALPDTPLVTTWAEARRGHASSSNSRIRMQPQDHRIMEAGRPGSVEVEAVEVEPAAAVELALRHPAARALQLRVAVGTSQLASEAHADGRILPTSRLTL